jgi:uncharacterized protein
MPRIVRDTHIVVFAKAPQPGTVKTRLVPLLGKARAAALQAQLLEHALRTASRAHPGRLFLYCAPDTTHPFFQHCASAYGAMLRPQASGDLGARMLSAFEQTLQEAPHIVLIGSDCPALTVDHLLDARRGLRAGYDAVFAPAEDGGYTLVALKRSANELFQGIAWSEATVMHETRRRLRQLGWSWHELETVWDVDRPSDYRRLLESGLLATVRPHERRDET